MKRIISLFLISVLAASLGSTALAVPPNDSGQDDWTVITLDPGHGGNGGAASVWYGRTYSEAEIVLKIANFLKEELESYYHVRVCLTRETDSPEEYEKISELIDRCKIAKENNSAAFISLHINSSEDQLANGATVLIPNGNYRPELAAKDRELARCVLSQLISAGLNTSGDGYLIRNSETHPPETYPDGSIADYYGIVRGGILLEIPTVLVEHCFLSNYNDAMSFLSTDEKLRILAHADCMGIAEFLDLKKPEDVPVPPDDTEKDHEGDDDGKLSDLPFSDVPVTSWYYEDIAYVYRHGIMAGVNAHTFGPGKTMTRAMFAQLLYNLEGAPEAPRQTVFEDVSADTWYADAVNWAYEKGIVLGKAENRFAPDEKISREQMATLLFRYAQYKGYNTSLRAEITSFNDADKINAYAEDAMMWAYAAGIISGKGSGILDPGGNAERSQAAALMHRFAENIAQSD